MLVEVLDFVSAFFVVVCLWKAPGNRCWWLVYFSTCIVIVPLMFYKGLFGNMSMCIALGITALKNYREAGRLKNVK